MKISQDQAGYRLGSDSSITLRQRPAPALRWFATLVTIAVVAGTQIGPLASPRIATLAPEAGKPLLSGDDSRPVLSPKMAAALESVALRYRVSPEALQPVFLAAQAAARDLDPLLVVAVIGVESGFNPIAQSVMGAQGLMQVIPRFHKDKVADAGSEAGLLDPVSNIQVGVRVLREAVRRQGSVVDGLQYYGGAVDDPDRTYATRVLAEKQRLESAFRQRRTAMGTKPLAVAGR